MFIDRNPYLPANVVIKQGRSYANEDRVGRVSSPSSSPSLEDPDLGGAQEVHVVKGEMDLVPLPEG
jgi:hypothetical protein